MKNKTKYLILLTLLTIGYGVFVFMYSQSIQIFPFEKNQNIYLFDSYRENSENHSNPKVKWSTSFNNETLSLSYKLTQDTSVFRAFAGLTIFKKDTILDLFDFSKFNSISIDMESEKGRKIPFLLYMHFERNVHDGKYVLNVPLTFMINYTGPKTYNIPFDQFKIPDWWVESKGIKREELTSFDFSKITLIIVESCFVLERGQEDKITIRNMTVHNKNSWVFLYVGTPVLVLLVTLSLIQIFRNKVKKDPQLELERKEENDLSKITNYLNNHYHNPDLNIYDLNRELNITTVQIEELLETHLNKSFEQTLQSIRIDFAKQLLTDSDQGIGLISFNVGFHSAHLFTEIFISIEEISPQEFIDRFRPKNQTAE